MPRAIDVRFWEKVDFEDIDGCWLWTGALTKGHGRFNVSGRSVPAHRVAWLLEHGEDAPGQLDHECRVKHCVRPGHLRVATDQENQQNRAGAQANSKSGVRGVCWHRPTGKWIVQVGHEGRNNYGGLFVDKGEAERAAIALRNRLVTHNGADRPPLNGEEYEETA